MAEDVAMIARHRWLVWELAKREHADRHAGSLFGSAWAIGHPLLLMTVISVQTRIAWSPRLDHDRNRTGTRVGRRLLPTRGSWSRSAQLWGCISSRFSASRIGHLRFYGR